MKMKEFNKDAVFIGGLILLRNFEKLAIFILFFRTKFMNILKSSD